MRRLTVWLLCIMVLLIAGCGSRPPTPTLTIHGEKIAYEEGSYYWKKWNGGVHAESPHAPWLVSSLAPEAFPPGSELEIKYSRKPNKNIVTLWVGFEENAEEIEQFTVEGNSFSLPLESGLYIYSLRSEWKNGSSGTFAFVVEVDEE